MLVRIREVRKAKRLTLLDVAERCVPPTTAQTIGRLETGMRNVTVPWLNRIAAALGVTPDDLTTHPERHDVPVAAILAADGAVAPTRAATLLSPAPGPAMLGLQVHVALGDYRAGDELWLERIEAADFASALNRDVLVPRAAGRFAFGRLLATAPADNDTARLQILPLAAGARQIVADAPWIAVARTLVRTLA